MKFVKNDYGYKRVPCEGDYLYIHIEMLVIKNIYDYAGRHGFFKVKVKVEWLSRHSQMNLNVVWESMSNIMHISKPVYTVKQKVNKSRKDTQNAISINK